MRFLVFFIILLYSNFGFGQQRQYKIICTGFYNLENLFDTIDDPHTNDADFLPGGANHYTAQVYFDKLSKLSHVISEIAMDKSKDGLALVGVAEVENRQVLEDLVKQDKISNRNYKIIHFDSPDERGIDVGLLYNPNYFKPKKSEALYVDIRNDDDTPRYTRDVLYVNGLLDGELVHLFVNHWPSRRGGEEASAPSRAKAASVCRNRIDSIQLIDPQARIILMGDFNDDPISPSIANVLGAKNDITAIENKSLYNPWNDLYKMGIGTLAYNDAWNLFDMIIFSEPYLNRDSGKYYFSGNYIYKEKYMIQSSGRFKGYPKRTYDFSRYAGGYSDHFPTYIVWLKEIKD